MNHAQEMSFAGPHLLLVPERSSLSALRQAVQARLGLPSTEGMHLAKAARFPVIENDLSPLDEGLVLVLFPRAQAFLSFFNLS
jgi:hypothetical protein